MPYCLFSVCREMHYSWSRTFLKIKPEQGYRLSTNIFLSQQYYVSHMENWNFKLSLKAFTSSYSKKPSYFLPRIENSVAETSLSLPSSMKKLKNNPTSKPISKKL